jgi:hypothetical protein
MAEEQAAMKVSIEVNGEFITTEVPVDSTVRALFEDGHLRGIDTINAIRVNGHPATAATVVKEGDTVATAPVGGRLA